MSIAPLLDISGLSKSFPGLRALDDVSFAVRTGEVVALVGQNGSGKSTLVKILAGVHQPDPGSVVDTRGAGRDDATELHFIHQDLGLVPMLSTVENLDLSRALGRRALLPTSTRRESARAEALLREFGVGFDVRAPVRTLTPAERTIVAIVRALDGWTHDHNVLVLDEPTAALHGDEARRLLDVVQRVAGRGTGVIYISHRLDEVIHVADRVVALRDGRTVLSEVRGEFDHDALVRAIAGEAVDDRRRSARTAAGGVRLKARAVSAEAIAHLDLDVRGGEIVGVAGLLGSGREQIARALFGAVPARGEIHVDGHALATGSPRASIDRGVAFVPADRKAEGGVMPMSARENLTLSQLGSLTGRGRRIDRRRERSEAIAWFERIALRPCEPERRLGLFSGGNQQKVVLARWLRQGSGVLLLEEPTQGIDVGAKGAIYGLVRDAADAGAAVLVSSSDAKELAHVCDRVVVMRDGRVAGEVAGDALTEQRLVAESLGVEVGELDQLSRPTTEETHGRTH